MRKFLTEVIIFSIVLFSLLQVMKGSLPYYWANPVLTNKMEFLDTNKDKFDGYFIGSSRTYRHINPKIIMNETGVRSFNLGAPAMFTLESEYILDNFIKENYSQDSTIVFIQTNNIYKIKLDDIAEKNRHSVRTNYYMDSKRMIRAVSYFFQKKDFRQVYYHVSAFIENKLCIGQFSEMYKFRFGSIDQVNLNVVKQNGFYPLEQDMEENNDKTLLARNKSFFRNVSNGMYKKKSKRRAIKINITKGSLSDLPEYNGNYELYGITGGLRYDPKFYFDKGHYNSAGADKYSKLIAKEIKKLNVKI